MAAAGGILWAVSLSSCATDLGAPNPGLELRQPILGAPATREDNVLLKWDEAALSAIRRTHPGPPQVARALAVIHTSIFDAWAAYDAIAVGTKLGGTLNRWQPLRISDGHGGTVIQTFVAPFWGRVIPFALTSAAQFRPPVPRNQFPFGGYQKQVEEILKYSSQLTDEQKVIAEYWADGPGSELPPGHWCLFAAYVSRRDGHDIDADVGMFFALTNALLDAGISVWEAKRFFDSVRPITAVHFWKLGKMIRAWGGPGRGAIVMRGEDWQPYQLATIVTPPFAEFPSGHSAFSAAAAEILMRFTAATGWARWSRWLRLPPASSPAWYRRIPLRSHGRLSPPPLTRRACHDGMAAFTSPRETSIRERWVGRSARKPGSKHRPISKARPNPERDFIATALLATVCSDRVPSQHPSIRGTSGWECRGNGSP